MDTIGKRFKEIREIFGYKQGDFANLFALSQDAISAIERDKNNPNFKVLKILHIEHKVNLNWLITGTGEKLLEAVEENADFEKLYLEIEDLKKRVGELEGRG